MSAPAKRGPQEPYIKDYAVPKEMWERMNELEQEQIKHASVYQHEFQLLKVAGARAVQALVKHQEEVRKDVVKKWREADQERSKIMKKYRMRMKRARKRASRLAEKERIKLKKRLAGLNSMKNPGRQP